VKELTQQLGAGVVPKEEEHWYTDDHKQQRRPSLKSEIEIKDCLPFAMSFRLLVKGQLRSSGEPVEDLDVVFTISLRYVTGSVTGWHWLVAESC
jgi:hypothetical protein